MKKFLVKLICFFVPVKKWRKQLKKYLYDCLGSDFATKKHPQAKGDVLVVYMKDSLLLEDGDPKLKYHTNRWENREIARIFYELGYSVDCVDFNIKFKSRKKYDIVFFAGGDQASIKDAAKPEALKLFHLTGSDGQYNNRQEKKRLDDLEKRRGVRLAKERVGGEMILCSGVADAFSLVGNEHTLNTYPPELREKITLIHLTGSELSRLKTEAEFCPPEREFLWMGGAGPVHKGLDLLIEVFAKHPEWKLNIMSKLTSGKEFMKVYKNELEMSNILLHGLVMPSSEKFNQVVSRCVAYINPSCAEATSTATVTALSAGLYPVISYDNGLDLPQGCGIYLQDCSLAEIENAVACVMAKSEDEIRQEIKIVQQNVLRDFSRENFRGEMLEYIKKQIDVHKVKCGL